MKPASERWRKHDGQLLVLRDLARARVYAIPGRTVSLFSAVREPVVSVAPCLIALGRSPTSLSCHLGAGWDRAAEVYLLSDRPFEQLGSHLESLLTIQTEDGDILYFRYYDPRVLRVFLPTCTPDQIVEFFGPIIAFYVEAEDPRYCLVLTHENGALKTETLDLQAPVAGIAATG